MATWQFLVHLVPRAWVEMEGSHVDMLYEPDSFDTSIAWTGNQPVSDPALAAGRILPSVPAWSSDLKMWGDVRSDDIQIWYEGTTVDCVQVRIDASGDTFAMCAKTIEFANALDCYLFIPTARTIMRPVLAELHAALLSSKAASFVSNPRAFLDALK